MAATMSAWTLLVSWNASTSMWSKLERSTAAAGPEPAMARQ